MEKIKKDLTDKRVAEESRNVTAIIGICIMNAILVAAYMVEVLKGTRTWGSYAIVVAGCILPCILSILAFLRKRETITVRYISSIGFLLIYTYMIFTSTTNLSFCYVIVIFVLLALYVDKKLSLLIGSYAVIANIALVIYHTMTLGLEEKEITEAEIIMACLILTCVFTLMANSRISRINQANMDKAEKEKEQTKEILKTVLNISDTVVENLSRASIETEQLEKSLDGTKKAMEELTGGAKDAVDAILLQQTKTDEINERIDAVGVVTQAIITETNDVETNLENGQSVMDDLLHQVAMSEEASKLVAGEMDGLQGYADQMKEIMALISNVASQTSILALNASIEAARAGNAGKGFAVVASEISNLAGQTSSATATILDVIKNITKALAEVTESVDKLLKSNSLQNDYVSKTADNYDKIHNSTQGIFQQNAKLKEMVDVVSEANKIVIGSAENVSAVMQEVNAGADETLQGSMADLDRVAALSRVMENLSKNAEELRITKEE